MRLCSGHICLSTVDTTAPAQEAFTLPAGVILAEYRDHFEAYEPLERRFLLYKGEGISPNQLPAAAHPKRTSDGAFPTHAPLFQNGMFVSDRFTDGALCIELRRRSSLPVRRRQARTPAPVDCPRRAALSVPSRLVGTVPAS